MNLETSFELKESFVLNFYAAVDGVRAFIQSKDRGKSWTGLVEGLDIQQYLWMIKTPSLLMRRIFVCEKSLKIKFLRGLLGSGSERTDFNLNLRSYYLDPNRDQLMRDNHSKALALSIKIKEALTNGSFEKNDIDELMKIEYYKVASPYSIARNLIMNMNNNALWNDLFFEDDRQKVVLLIKKYLFFHMIVNFGRPIFDSREQNELLSIITPVIQLVDSNKSASREFCLILDLKIIEEFIKNSINCVKPWKKLLKGAENLFKYLARGDYYNLIVQPIKSFCSLTESETTISNYWKSVEIIILIEGIYEKSKIFQDYLITEFENVKNNKWEKIYILLNFAKEWINNKKIRKKSHFQIIG